MDGEVVTALTNWRKLNSKCPIIIKSKLQERLRDYRPQVLRRTAARHSAQSQRTNLQPVSEAIRTLLVLCLIGEAHGCATEGLQRTILRGDPSSSIWRTKPDRQGTRRCRGGRYSEGSWRGHQGKKKDETWFHILNTGAPALSSRMPRLKAIGQTIREFFLWRNLMVPDKRTKDTDI